MLFIGFFFFSSGYVSLKTVPTWQTENAREEQISLQSGKVFLFRQYFDPVSQKELCRYPVSRGQLFAEMAVVNAALSAGRAPCFQNGGFTAIF